MSSGEIIELSGVTKSFGSGATEVEILHGIDLQIGKGEFVALIGPSGSGKSTLLNILGLLDKATSGVVRLFGNDISQADDDRITTLRGESLGFIFQSHHLIPALSVLENIMMPAAAISGGFAQAQRDRAESLLKSVGLAGKGSLMPRELSGGMQQRVAVARGLMNRPSIVFADEPTGNLDTGNSDKVFELLKEENRQDETSFLIVTHNEKMANRCDRVLKIVDGNLVFDGRPGKL